MPYTAKNKYGLIYKRPGNTDTARSHEEVEGDYTKNGVSTGIAYQEVFNEDELDKQRMEELGKLWK